MQNITLKDIILHILSEKDLELNVEQNLKLAFRAQVDASAATPRPYVGVYLQLNNGVDAARVAQIMEFAQNSVDQTVNVLEWLTPLDPAHPTTVGVIKRPENYANERTDNRDSIAYVVVSCGRLDFIEFHEGKNPTQEVNGYLSEDLIAILLHRTNYHQAGPFKSRENALCATALEQAGLWLYARRVARKAAGTSGTQKV